MNKKPNMLSSLTPKSVFVSPEIGSVARLEVSARDFNWRKPYQKGNSYSASGSASLIELPDSLKNDTDDFFLLTAFHVVENTERIWSTFSNANGELFETKLVGACPEIDIAILRIENLPQKVKDTLKRFTLGDSDQLKVQQPVAAAGFPFAQNTVTIVEGVLSGIQNTYLQTTVPINSGNSGGPLIESETGKIVGVVVSTTKHASGMNYAVPTRQILIHLEKMLKGFTRLPSFNFYTSMATPALLERFECPENMIGSFVKYIFTESPFYKAGMRQGDIFTAITVEKQKYHVGFDGNVTVPWWTSPVTMDHIEQRLKLDETITIEYWSIGESRLISEKITLTEPNLQKLRYYYKQFEKPEYEVFGGLVVMQLTQNHIDYDDDDWSPMFTFLQSQEPEKEWEPILVVTDVLAESSLRALVDKSISITDVVTHVHNIEVKTIEEYRKAIHARTDYITWQTRDGMKTALEYDVAKDEYEIWIKRRK